jgi:hypothetical protein
LAKVDCCRGAQDWIESAAIYVLTQATEAAVVVLLAHTLLPLDGYLYALQVSVAQ